MAHHRLVGEVSVGQTISTWVSSFRFTCMCLQSRPERCPCGSHSQLPAVGNILRFCFLPSKRPLRFVRLTSACSDLLRGFPTMNANLPSQNQFWWQIALLCLLLTNRNPNANTLSWTTKYLVTTPGICGLPHEPRMISLSPTC